MRTLFAIAIVACACAAQAAMIIPANHNDHALLPGASLSDVKMSVGLSVNDGWATFTFANASDGAETSARLHEIVIDGWDNDSFKLILWDPRIVDSSDGVRFDDGWSNGLPGFNQLTKETPALYEFNAKNKDALGIGDYLTVAFRTTLPDGSDLDDYFAPFGGGCDQATGSIGFHAISVAVVDGQSVSGVVVPEPALAALLVVGGAAILLRRRPAHM